MEIVNVNIGKELVVKDMFYNGLHIPEGGDYEAQNYQLTMNINRSTDVHISTKTPILGICCYRLGFYKF
jgi:hypothetical protein